MSNFNYSYKREEINIYVGTYIYINIVIIIFIMACLKVCTPGNDAPGFIHITIISFELLNIQLLY